MIRRLSVLLLFAAAAASAQSSRSLKAWYKDGTSLEVYTESSGGSARTSTHGSVIVDSTNDVHRVVVDQQGKVLFAYDVEASSAPASTDSYQVRIKPVGARIRSTISPSGSYVPTVVAIRDFPNVKLGEAVMVDILFNPATGEKIYDVLRPGNEPRRFSGGGSAGAGAIADEFSFGDLQIVIDGQTFTHATGAVLTGPAARIYVPGHGAYYLSAGPAAGLHEIGHAERRKLRFEWSGNHVEIVSNRNVLTQSERRVVWVRHDPTYLPQGGLRGQVDVMTADKVEYLMPKARE